MNDPLGAVTVSSTATEAEWDLFVAARGDATFSHRWRWREIFRDAFGHDSEYLIARRGADISGVLPLVKFRSRLFGRFLVSLPFVNDGGLLTCDEASSAALLEAAMRVARDFGAEHIELRHRCRRQSALPYRSHKVGMLLPLQSSAEAIWAGLDRKVRNQVRKAQKSGLEVVAGGAELVRDFYPVFAHTMRDLGTPVYSRRLFEEVLGRFPQDVRIFTVRHDGRTIAGAVACSYHGACEVPWASSLKDYRHLSPNMLLYWSMIERAAQEGHRVFDFGRSTPDEGTFHFKRQWGAEPHPLHWEYVLIDRTAIPDQGPKNAKFRSAIETWKRLPLPLTNLAGPWIARSIP
jgi:serine/alanine adding enzyme